MTASATYVERRDDEGYWVTGTRVSLDSVVYRFLEGLSPESIQADCFPALTLEQVYGAITYYLHNRAEVNPLPPAGGRGVRTVPRARPRRIP